MDVDGIWCVFETCWPESHVYFSSVELEFCCCCFFKRVYHGELETFLSFLFLFVSFYFCKLLVYFNGKKANEAGYF